MPNDREKQTITPDSVGDVASILGQPIHSIPADPKDDEIVVTPKGRAMVADIRAKEANDVLLWLSNNGCLSTSYGTMDKALAAIERGDHRR